MSTAPPTGHGMLMTTVPTRADAARIADMLVGEKLAACVQMLPIESVYIWDGKKQNEAELLLLVKTHGRLFEAAIARIKALHPYDVPEIVATPFTAGFAPYLAWIDAATDG